MNSCLRGEINLQFVADIHDEPNADEQLFRTISQRMLPDTARILQQEIADLAERIDNACSTGSAEFIGRRTDKLEIYCCVWNGECFSITKR